MRYAMPMTVILAVLTIGCSVAPVAPTPLPVPPPAEHTPLRPDELARLRGCTRGDCLIAVETLRTLLANYQHLLAAHAECLAVVQSTHP